MRDTGSLSQRCHPFMRTTTLSTHPCTHTPQTNTWNELRAKQMEEARALLEACARKEPKRHAAPLEPLQVQINKSQISNQQTTDQNQQTTDLKPVQINKLQMSIFKPHISSNIAQPSFFDADRSTLSLNLLAHG